MPPMPRANRRMNDLMRKERSGLEDYMYKGGEQADRARSEVTTEEPPDTAAIIAIQPDNEAAEPTPDSEMAEGEAAGGMTVLNPGDEDPEDMYVYAQGETPGAWTMYPPGVPCDTETTRVALDHPATAADLAKMDQEVGADSASASAYSDVASEGVV